jgi:uncharacterized protein YkwD
LLGGTALAPASLSAQAPSGPCAVTESQNAPPVVLTSMVAEINRYRAALNVSQLVLSENLTRAALWKATDQANGGPATHDDSFRPWYQRFADCGYPADAAGGEIFSTVDGVLLSPQEVAGVFESWRRSPVHDRVLGDPMLRAIGIARVKAPYRERFIWAVTFGWVDDTVTATATPTTEP